MHIGNAWARGGDQRQTQSKSGDSEDSMVQHGVFS
jgi:hypothetical protein